MKCVSRLSAHNNLSAFRGMFTWAHLSQERRMTRSPRRCWLDALRRTEKDVYRSQSLTSEQPTPHPPPSAPGGRGRAARVRQVFLQTQVSADGCVHECCWRSLYALVCMQRALSVTITFIRFHFYWRDFRCINSVNVSVNSDNNRAAFYTRVKINLDFTARSMNNIYMKKFLYQTVGWRPHFFNPPSLMLFNHLWISIAQYNIIRHIQVYTHKTM